MKYVDIPHTDLHVSQICLGSTDFGATVNADETFALLDAFMAQGGNFIDTAHVYSNWMSEVKSISEKTIGQWVKARNNRDQVVLATKGAHPELDSMHVSRLSPREIVLDIEESLEYLQTDTIDLYWLHRDDVVIPVGEILDVLGEQVQAGRIRYLGVSNWTLARLKEAVDYGARTGKPTFIANQPLWNLALPNMALHPDQTLVAMDKAMMDYHTQTQMAAVAYSSQVRGFFSKLNTLGVEGTSKAVSEADWAVYNHKANHIRFERSRELAQKHHASINDIVLSYLLSQPFPAIPIIGSKRIDQLQSSLTALDVVLTPDELAYLEVGQLA